MQYLKTTLKIPSLYKYFNTPCYPNSCGCIGICSARSSILSLMNLIYRRPLQ